MTSSLRHTIPISLLFFTLAGPAWSESTPASKMSSHAALSGDVSKKRTFFADDIGSESTAVVHVIRQSLPELLHQVARRDGYVALISSKISGLVKDRRFPIDVPNIMPKLADQYGLIWHLEGKQLFVVASEERTEKTFKLGKLDPQKLYRVIADFGIQIGNHQLHHIPSDNSVRILGAPHFIAKIERLSKKIENEVTDANTDMNSEGGQQ